MLIDELVKFRDARQWKQFHNTKDLALALSIEAAELMNFSCGSRLRSARR